MSVQEQVIEKFKEIRHSALQNLPEAADEESELEESAAELWDDAKKVRELAKEIGGLLRSRYGCLEIGDFEILCWKIGRSVFFPKDVPLQSFSSQGFFVAVSFYKSTF